MQSFFQLFLGIFVVLIVYSKTETLNGWTQPELLAAVGTFAVVTGVMRSLVQPPLLDVASMVHDGTLDYVLLAPIDAQLVVSTRKVGLWQLLDVAVGFVIIGFSLPSLDASWADAVAFIALLAAGSVVVYSLVLLLVSAVFWAVSLPFIPNLLHYVSRSAQYPITLYPTWLRLSLTFIVPLGVAVTTPAQAITNRLDLASLGTMLLVTVIFAAVSRLVWRAAVRRYAGASA